MSSHPLALSAKASGWPTVELPGIDEAPVARHLRADVTDRLGADVLAPSLTAGDERPEEPRVHAAPMPRRVLLVPHRRALGHEVRVPGDEGSRKIGARAGEG